MAVVEPTFVCGPYQQWFSPFADGRSRPPGVDLDVLDLVAPSTHVEAGI